MRDHEGKIQEGEIKGIDFSDLNSEITKPFFREKICKMIAKNGHIPHKNMKKEQNYKTSFKIWCGYRM